MPHCPVSIIMTVHNGERFIDAAIRSALSQTRKDFELIVFDDGSTDRSREIVASLAQTDARIRSIPSGRVGRVGALRGAIDVAAGARLAILDSDDLARPQRLEKEMAFLDKHSDVATVGGGMRMIDALGKPMTRVRVPTGSRTIHRRLLRHNCFVQSTVLMRREAYESVGGYRRVFPRCEDYDLWLRMSERYALANVRDVLVDYRIHDQQMSVEKVTEQVMCVIAMQAAARMRRAGKPDPFTDDTPMQWTDLARVGIDDAQAGLAVAHGYLTYADMQIRAGQVEAARSFLDIATWPAAARAQSGRVIGRRAYLLSLLDWAQTRRWSSLASMCGRCVRHPAFGMRQVIKEAAMLLR